MKLSLFSVQDHHPSRSRRTVSQLYDQVLGLACLAEQYGYEGFFVAEHHFHEYGVVPNPAVMLAAMAQRTRRIKLGSAISILTFHSPLTTAENYSMLDTLSGGRLVFGVGSGYLKHEFEGYNIDGPSKRERFDENLMLVERLLTGERVTFRGRYNTLDAVQINVLPVQQDLPLHVAVLRKEAAYHVGRQGRRMMCVPYASVDSFDGIGEIMDEYRRGREEVGLTDHRGMAMMALHAHVAESDAAARRVAASPFDLYVATRLYAKSATYDDVIRNGLSLFGSPEAVADKLLRLHEMGVDHVLTLQNFGLMPMEEVQRSIRMMAQEVMPRLVDRFAKTLVA
jgi:alkanesulfonate monooxygenase SsuD/methylene tetrahydromethanopterin reductase-like flavin-dependent oxidoreductase (luciferase family)